MLTPDVNALQMYRSARQLSPPPLLHTVAQRIRRLQNTVEGSVATVATPEEFSAALEAGSAHIEVVEHLDFSLYKGSTQLNWTAAFHIPEGVKSIHVRRSQPSATFLWLHLPCTVCDYNAEILQAMRLCGRGRRRLRRGLGEGGEKLSLFS